MRYDAGGFRLGGAYRGGLLRRVRHPSGRRCAWRGGRVAGRRKLKGRAAGSMLGGFPASGIGSVDGHEAGLKFRARFQAGP